MAEIIIIGSGPAGISAALYTVRAGIKTTVIGRDEGSLGKTEKIENYYGFSKPIEGSHLVEQGIRQAERLGVNILKEEVVGLTYDGQFVVKTTGSEYKAEVVIIATGSQRAKPPIKGFPEFEGKGISYCAVCDAFFYRGKDVAVLGCCEYALSEAMELLPIAKSVHLISNGQKAIQFPPEIPVIETKIAELAGDDRLREVKFEDRTTLPVSGVFVAMGVAGSGDLARKLGAVTKGEKIAVDEDMATNIPGLYAAGDCTGGMLQIAKAVYEGAKAGTEAVKFIRKQSKQ